MTACTRIPRKAPAAARVLLATALLLAAAPAARAGGEAAWPCPPGDPALPSYPSDVLFKKIGFDGAAAAPAQEGEESALLAKVRELDALLFPQPPSDMGKLAGLLTMITSVFSGLKGSAALDLTDEDRLWLGSLAKPSIVTKWSPRLVKYLLSFRDDAKWKQVLATWFSRRELYGWVIRRELACRGLPEDLQFVAMVESGYDPGATSGAGAAGIWQFMPGTGGAMGLPQSSWMDQRRNPELSSAAAAVYLRDLKRRMGSWPLALASYNAGAGTVGNAVRGYNTNDFDRLSQLEGALPGETMTYVPKIQALAVVWKNAARFPAAGVETLAPLLYEVAPIPDPVHLSLVAKAAGTQTEILRELNPELRKNRVPPELLPYPLRLPAGTDMAAFAAAFTKAGGEYTPLELYAVKFGDTVKRIASLHGITVKELRLLNELGKDETPPAGTRLLVPSSAKGAAATPGGAKGETGKEVVVVPDAGLEVPGRTRVFYKVVEGDTLGAMALYFKVGVADIVAWNALDPEALLFPGLVVQLFVDPSFDRSGAVLLGGDEVSLLDAGSPAHVQHMLDKEGRKRVVYTVKEGETLKEIGKRFKISVPFILALNGGVGKGAVTAGVKLVLYVGAKVYKKHFSASAPPAGGAEVKTKGTEEVQPDGAKEPAETAEPPVAENVEAVEEGGGEKAPEGAGAKDAGSEGDAGGE